MIWSDAMKASNAHVAASALALALRGVLACGCTGEILGPDKIFDPGPSPTGRPSFLPARIRRLTGLELDASVQALLGPGLTVSGQLPADVRQLGFTRNAAAIFD